MTIPKELEEMTNPGASISLLELHLIQGKSIPPPPAAPTIKGPSVESNRKGYGGPHICLKERLGGHFGHSRTDVYVFPIEIE